MPAASPLQNIKHKTQKIKHRTKSFVLPKILYKSESFLILGLNWRLLGHRHAPILAQIAKRLINKHSSPKSMVLRKVLEKAFVNKMLITCEHNTISCVLHESCSAGLISVDFLARSHYLV